MTYQEQFHAMMKDPAVRNWVKKVAEQLQEHDPVDALHDCELLVSMAKARLKNIEGKKNTGCPSCDANGGYPCSDHDGSKYE